MVIIRLFEYPSACVHETQIKRIPRSHAFFARIIDAMLGISLGLSVRNSHGNDFMVTFCCFVFAPGMKGDSNCIVKRHTERKGCKKKANENFE